MFFLNKHVKKVITALLLIYFVTNIASAQIWVGGGPTFKNIKTVAQSPTNPNLVYAGAFGWGVFKSTDGGVTWTSIKTGMTNTHVRSILAISDLVVFAGTNDGVFKTTNGGVTWTITLATLNSVRGLAYDSKTGTSYAATYGSGLYKSTNQGSSWTTVIVTDPSTGETMSRLWSVEIYGRDSIYVGGSILDITNGGTLFNSINGGVNWTQVQYPTGIRSSVRSIAISPNNPASSLIIGTAAKGVYKSTNGGLNWTEINAGTTLNPLIDNQINVVGFSTNYRYAGTDSLGKFYYRSLGDISTGWLSGTGLPGTQAVVDAIDINPISQNIIYLGTDGKGVYKSIDSGFTWQARNSGMLGTGGRVIKLNGNGQIILGTDFGDGIWLSSNQTASWITADTLTTSNSITSIGITNNNLILYSGDYGTGVYKSTDGGHIWHITDSTVINHFIRTLVVHPSNSNLVYAGTGNGVYKTTNAGAAWFATNNGLPFGASVRSMKIDPTNSNIIYIGTDSSYMYKTIDAGASWIHFTNLNGFLPQDKFIRSITVDHTAPNNIYVGVDSGRIYKSTSSGVAWSLMSRLPATRSVRSILINPHNPMILFAGTFGDGIFLSVDGGIHWATYNNGLPDLDIYTLESDNATPLNIYAGTGSHGVFHTTYTFVNRPPVLATIGNKSVLGSQSLAFTISSTDSDGTAPVLSVHPLPSGAVFIDSANGHGSFNWIPLSSQLGTYSITFVSSDGLLADSELVTISVLDPAAYTTIDIPLEVGWNLIAVPVKAIDPRKATIFPSFVSAAFAYTGNYQPSDTLLHGVGYWLKSSIPQVAHVTGSRLIQDTINVLSGWNLIGSLSSTIPVTSMNALPPISITSQVYAYSPASGYRLADSLNIGKGFWVKVNNSGKLILMK
ncbi:MAG: hypothetical protein Q8K98_08965 [Bacteroidota bacterium]|nr:hypothetical protein [Bacteroidota bacterium]